MESLFVIWICQVFILRLANVYINGTTWLRINCAELLITECITDFVKVSKCCSQNRGKVACNKRPQQRKKRWHDTCADKNTLTQAYVVSVQVLCFAVDF